jgi:hypothetical protein
MVQSISIWAKQNTNKARIFITLAHIFLYVDAVSIAILLQKNHIQLPTFVGIIAVGFVCLSIYFFECIDYHNQLKHLRKFLHFFIAIFTFIFTVFIYSDNNRVSNFNAYSHLNGSLIKPNDRLINNKVNSKITLKKAIRMLKSGNKNHIDALSILEILGLIVLAAFLCLILVALSCSLACSGAGFFAILIGIGGLVGIGFFIKWIGKKIQKGANRRYEINKEKELIEKTASTITKK